LAKQRNVKNKSILLETEVMKCWFVIQSLWTKTDNVITLPPTYGMYGVLLILMQ
jgi:hypothetical protein